MESLIIISILLLAVIILCFFFLRNTYYCTGSWLLKGCNRLLFPWSGKILVEDDRYCCRECFKKELDIMDSSDKKTKNKNRLYEDLPDFRKIK